MSRMQNIPTGLQTFFGRLGSYDDPGIAELPLQIAIII